MGLLKWIGDFVGKGVAEETIEDTQERVEQVTKHVIKSLSLLLIFFIGLIFLLVGISQTLQDKISAITPGTGYLIVGSALIVMAIIVKALK